MSKISVALCTFNGERYIKKQLQSVINQAQSIDELIVCDDGSADKTVEILTEITRSAPFKTQLIQNEQQLGSTKNFEKALQYCTGDIVFLCDQDDEWHPQKVARQVSFLNSNPEIEAVFTNASLINQQSELTGSTLWEQIGFDDNSKKKWQAGHGYELLFGSYVVTGATLAIRKDAIERILPCPDIDKQLIHDGWLALVLALENKIQFIDECLLYYRIHEAQQVGTGQHQRPTTLVERLTRDRLEKLTPLQNKAEYLTKLYALLAARSGFDKHKLHQLKAMKEHFEIRTHLPPNRLARVKPVWHELTQQRYRYSSQRWWLPLFGDIFE